LFRFLIAIKLEAGYLNITQKIFNNPCCLEKTQWNSVNL